MRVCCFRTHFVTGVSCVRCEQEAQEIFGDVDSFLQRYHDMKARSTGKDQYDLGQEGVRMSFLPISPSLTFAVPWNI
jgi:hypothetical protein